MVIRRRRPTGSFNLSPHGAERGLSLSGLAAVVMIGLVVYASLYPFQGWRWPPGSELTAVMSLPWPRWRDHADEWLNYLGYVPLGLCLSVAFLRRGWSPGLALVAGLIAPALLSYAMEVMQMFLPRRVPSLRDWVGNAAGAATGALAAVLAHRVGWLERGQLLRDRWFAHDSAAALVLLALWPVALLAPASLPFALGQCWEEIRALALALFGQLPLSALGIEFDLDILSEHGPEPALSVPAQVMAIALGALAPLALGSAAMPSGLRRSLLMAFMAGVAAGGMTLSTALNFGPAHAWSWLTPTALAAAVLCLPLALPLVWLPSRWCAAVALLVLVAGVALGAQMPTGSYHTLNLQAWEQGRFIRFHGLAIWMAWLWPYLAMAWLMRRLAAGGHQSAFAQR